MMMETKEKYFERKGLQFEKVNQDFSQLKEDKRCSTWKSLLKHNHKMENNLILAYQLSIK